MNKKNLEIVSGILTTSVLLAGCKTIEVSKTLTVESMTNNKAFATSTDFVTVTPEASMTAELPTEPLITATDEVTATPESLIEGNIFQDPQTEADFVTVVESPSPIDKPTDFAKWQDEYLRQIDEKLKTWSGTPITLDNIGYMSGGGDIFFHKKIWQSIASYKFSWQGKEILTKTFVAKDQNGNLVPFSVTYTTSNSPVFSQDSGYNTPAEAIGMAMRYEWERAKESVTDPFIDTFLPNRDKNTDSAAWARFFAGMGTSDDAEKTSRARFIIEDFGN
ncbi:MAG: hypothetical protein WC784_00945 [Candidatus Shapirobacteria bacterium]|jgi:hypothetical protein